MDMQTLELQALDVATSVRLLQAAASEKFQTRVIGKAAFE